MAKGKTRIYTVTDGTVERLIRAGNKSQAVRCFAANSITAKVASQDDIIEAVGSGSKIVDATADTED